MTNFHISSKTYVKSSNSVSKIIKNYLLTLIAFLIYLLIFKLIIKDFPSVINILKTSFITIIISIIITYIYNLIKKEPKISHLKETISISLIITLFSYNNNLFITVIALIISLIIKNISKKRNLSSSLYGLLFLILYNYFTNSLITPLTKLSTLNYIGSYASLVLSNGNLSSYLIGTIYLSPILSIVLFFYLFHKKSIKYELVFSYIITFSFIMLVFGILKGMNIYYVFFQLTTGNFLFLSTYGLSDSSITPTIGKGQIIYGIILGTMTAILRFIIPELSVIIALIIGPLILTKFIDKISPKLKYNDKYLTTAITFCLLFVVITITTLYFLI